MLFFVSVFPAKNLFLLSMFGKRDFLKGSGGQFISSLAHYQPPLTYALKSERERSFLN